MTPADNDDRKRLERRLKKLAGVPHRTTVEGREIGAGPDLLSALLTEVDETVLARRLAFRLAANRPELRIDVYGRRLTGLALPAPPGLPAALAGLFGRELGDSDAPALRQLLEGWLAGADGLWVVAEPAPEDRNPLAMGVAARALAAGWGVTLDTVPLLTEAAALDALARLPARAWLRRDAAGAETAHGTPSDVERLRSVTPLAGALPSCSILGGQPGGGALVRAEAGGESLTMLIEARNLGGVARAWRAALG